LTPEILGRYHARGVYVRRSAARVADAVLPQ
jgi:hypothetical protein